MSAQLDLLAWRAPAAPARQLRAVQPRRQSCRVLACPEFAARDLCPEHDTPEIRALERPHAYVFEGARVALEAMTALRDAYVFEGARVALEAMTALRGPVYSRPGHPASLTHDPSVPCLGCRVRMVPWESWTCPRCEPLLAELREIDAAHELRPARGRAPGLLRDLALDPEPADGVVAREGSRAPAGERMTINCPTCGAHVPAVPIEPVPRLTRSHKRSWSGRPTGAVQVGDHHGCAGAGAVVHTGGSR